MAVAAPKRRTAPAPPPSRTTPPKRRAAPKRKAAAPRASAVAVPAPSRAPARKPARKPTRKPARKAPARAPQRAVRPKVRRNPGARVIPFAGRTAVAVGQLPDSGLMVQMTRGRLWIGVLGVLLAGIVALNVVNLSLNATAATIDGQIGILDSENGVLKGRDATKSGPERVRGAARDLGFTQASSADTLFVDYGPKTIATAAARLAAASP
jgi:hypothetical protein